MERHCVSPFESARDDYSCPSALIIAVSQIIKPINARRAKVKDIGRPGEGCGCPENRPMSNPIHKFGKDWVITRTIANVLTSGGGENRNCEVIPGESPYLFQVTQNDSCRFKVRGVEWHRSKQEMVCEMNFPLRKRNTIQAQQGWRF